MKVYKFLLGSVLALTALSLGACGKGAENTTELSKSIGMGADSSGGSDLHSVYDEVAWFNDASRVINVCFEADRGLYPDSSLLKQNIEQAFQAWKSYATKKIGHDEFIDHSVTFNLDKTQITDPGLSFNVNVYSADNCDTNKSDLVVYFGKKTAQISGILNSKKNYALGFAQKNDYLKNVPDLWSKGFIWISDDSMVAKCNDAVYATILHELGHVYGISHIKGTIMDDAFANRAINYAANNGKIENLITKIDQERELFSSFTSYDYQATRYLNRNDWTENSSLYYESSFPWFKQIMQRNLFGKLKIRIKSCKTPPISIECASNAGTPNVAELMVGDELGVNSVSFILFPSHRQPQHFAKDGVLFKRLKSKTQDGITWVDVYSTPAGSLAAQEWYMPASINDKSQYPITVSMITNPGVDHDHDIHFAMRPKHAHLLIKYFDSKRKVVDADTFGMRSSVEY